MNKEPGKVYDHILAQAAQLDRQSQMELLADLTAQLAPAPETANTRKHSLGELEGIFKGVWEGQDAQEYVNRERDAWTG